jgi:pimeloyl-ACP methyl ester carboxylesterase/ribosomal protein S18 acetylase RimI-like enzyme
MKTEIREAAENDIEPILDFMKSYYEFDHLDYSREKLRATLQEFINSSSGSLFIIHSTGKPIGYFCLAFGYSLELHGKDCFLDEIFISQEYRQKGVGSQVMKFIEDYLKRKNFKSIHLIVFKRNIKAQQYYLRNGFRTRDAIFMTKSLVNMEDNINPTIGKLQVKGINIFYRRAGNGPPLMFIHGGAEDSRTWTPQLEALSDEFTVIAWDEPGAGKSSDVPDNFKLSDYADCFAGLITQLDLAPVNIAGLSWGSTVLLELYRRHPHLVRTMILAGGYAGWKGSLGEEEANARLAGARKMLSVPDNQFDPTLPGLFAGDPPAKIVPLLNAMAADVRRRSLQTMFEIMGKTDLNHVLPTITVPTLLLWGELDVRSPLSIAKEFELQISDAHLLVIPGCGHVINLQAPEAFNEAVRNFCRSD